MKRLVDDQLKTWSGAIRRKPLIVRGPRQVGKTYSIERFGKESFEDVLKVDLERNRDWHGVFSGTLSPKEILPQLELLCGKRITPGRTLLFLDEIQMCPRAVMALRYLYEECPELHVVAAGSLLDFALLDLSFPVGRVQFLEMHPMIFAEYLWARGKDAAAEIVLSEPKKVAQTTHDLLLGEIKKYCLVGGMPESVLAFVNTGSFSEAFGVQRELRESFRQDFSKYAPRVDSNCLDAVFTGVARAVGQQIKYTHLAPGYAHTTTKRAFDLLSMARVITKVPSANPFGLPLGASASSRRFKAILADVGLWQSLCGVKVEADYATDDLLSVYRGALAEQFVGQEMMVSQGSQLYYWAREARGSSAEVDFLAVVNGSIHPVEVKSGPAGRLKSLHLLLQSYPSCGNGLVFTTALFAALPEQRLTFLPLYFAYSATKGDS